MRVIFILALILLVNTSFAVQFAPLMKAAPKVEVKCNPSEESCLSLCQGELECVLDTALCRDCLGSSLFLTELYRSLGRSLLPSHELSIEKLFEDLKDKKLMVIDRRFFLNIFEDHNSFDFKEYYSLLCGHQDSMPILFAELDRNHSPDLSKLSVFCTHSQVLSLLSFQ